MSFFSAGQNDYSRIALCYQVWWTGLPPVPIPQDVIDRYAGGKVMAVVGFEATHLGLLSLKATINRIFLLRAVTIDYDV